MAKSIVWIASRLRFSGKSGDNSKAGTVVAIAGVAVAVAVMELTLSVVTGFKHEIRELVRGFDAQIVVGRPYNYADGKQSETLVLSTELAETIAAGIAKTEGGEISLSAKLPGMLQTTEDFSGVIFTAHDRNHDFGFEHKNMCKGQFPDYDVEDKDNSIVVSRIVADRLNLATGDRLYAYFFSNGSLKTRRLSVDGIYDSGMRDYDRNVVYASLAMLQSVMGADGDGGTQVDINGLPFDDVNDVTAIIQSDLEAAVQQGRLDEYYPVTTIFQTGAVYFNWLALLDTNVVVIFVLMGCVALFTLVSCLFMIVLDKIPTIGMLKSIGASRRWLTSLFVLLGMKLAIRGMLIGNLVGLALCFLQKSTNVVALDPDMYYLRAVPVEIVPLHFVILNVCVLAVAWTILYFPANSAAKIDVNESLKLG